VQSSKSSDIKKYKTEIMEVLREQIGFHYNLYEGQAEVSLQHDAAILEGRKVLKDSVTYNKLLSVN
jgi:carboxyl-terminal processing protease